MSNYSLRDLVLYFLKLGTIGFGGPVALVGYMERDLVEERRWISPEDFRQGLALSQLAPGPMAAQLAIYIGYVHSQVIGATAVGLAFILPSFLMVIAIAAAYVRYGGLWWMQALFYGIGAAVMAIIARSAYKLAKATIGSKRLLWMIFIVMAVVTAVTRQEIVWLFVFSGLISVLIYAPPRWLSRVQANAVWVGWLGLMAPQEHPSVPPSVLWQVFAFFAKAGLFVFGSGLAIVPFLYGGVVRDFHWLNERQFLDAVAVAMITPGPVVITVAFIGYLVAGLTGACLAACGVFVPVYLFVVLLAPWFRRNAGNPTVKAFVDGVTASAVGALSGAAIVLARGAIYDLPTLAIVAVALVLLLRYKIPEPILVAGAGAVGLLLYRG